MKDLEKYIKKASCNGKVVVENNDDNYIYIPYLGFLIGDWAYIHSSFNSWESRSEE